MSSSWKLALPQHNTVLAVPSALPQEYDIGPWAPSLGAREDHPLGRHGPGQAMSYINCMFGGMWNFNSDNHGNPECSTYISTFKQCKLYCLIFAVQRIREKAGVLVLHSLDIWLGESFLSQCLLAQGLEKPSRIKSTSKIIGYNKKASP